MYNENTNVAYDLSYFDTDESVEQKAKKRREQIKSVSNFSVARNGSMFKIIFAVAFAAAVAFAILFSKVQLSEYATMISEETTLLELAERENIRLQAQLDAMVTLDNVETYAEEELGLRKTIASQIKYINVDLDNLTEIAQDTDNIFYSIQNWANNVLEYLGF